MRERRKYFRLKSGLHVKHATLDRDDAKSRSLIEDISRDGARLSMREFIPRGSFLELAIRLPGIDEPLIAFAEVLWSRKKNDLKHEAGLRFTKIKGEDRARLLDHAYHELISGDRERFLNAAK